MAQDSNHDENSPLHPLELAAGDDNTAQIQAHTAFKGDSETAVSQWASAVRLAFGKNRRQFNLAVCDALASAGIMPTPACVLRVSKWGHHTSVADDVTHWMQSLTQRFAALQADVPLPARQAANDLIAKLYALSRTEAEKVASEQVMALREKFEALSEKFDDALTKNTVLRDTFDLKDAALHEQNIVLHGLRLEITDLKQALELAHSKIEHVQALNKAQEASALDNERAYLAAEAAAQIASIESKAAAAAALSQVQKFADTDRLRLMQRLDDQRMHDQAIAKELRTELNVAKAKLEAKQGELHVCSVLLAKQTAQHKAVEALLTTERSHWEVEKIRLESPDEKHRTLVMFAAIYRRIGLQITRDPAVDLAAQLQLQLGMTPNAAAIFLQQVPVTAEDVKAH